MTPPNIPFPYLAWHLYLEPIFALGGVYHLHWAPIEYMTYMPSTAVYSSSSQIVCDQLASAYLMFAFIEGVLLRVVDDMRTWWWIVLGLALCDAGHCYAAWCEMGTWLLLSPWEWDQKDVVTNVLNLLPLVTRIAFLCGVGIKKGGGGAKRR